MDMGDLSSEDSMLRAYLVYTTDLSPEMRAHTIFTTSRLSGDSSSGSVNRVGAGLDYTLVDGKHPLTLMANGILDVYNFREPDFNTSRISRFDVGLRYRVARDWYASLGYTTHNDSENDASGSGIFASVQYVEEPRECIECEPPLEEELPPPETTAAALDSIIEGEGENQPEPAPVIAQPPLMRSSEAEAPVETVEPGFRGDSSQPAENVIVDASEQAPDPEGEATDTIPEEPEPESVDPDLTSQRVASQATSERTGVIIPELPEDRPHHTAVGAVMVRTGVAELYDSRHHTSIEDTLLRTPTDPSSGGTLGSLIARELESGFQDDQATLLAMSSAAIASDTDESAGTSEVDKALDEGTPATADKTPSTAGG
jgi:hypothetical protein